MIVYESKSLLVYIAITRGTGKLQSIALTIHLLYMWYSPHSNSLYRYPS